MAGKTKDGLRQSSRAQAPAQRFLLLRGSPSQPPLTVLIVDDDPDQVDLLSRFLSHQGMVVVPAYSGAQCLRRASRRSLDAIVLNVVMPGMSGLEVCAALKKRTAARAIPIILLSAKNDLETRLEAMRLGVEELVAKPARGAELVARIHTQVRLSRKARKRSPRLNGH